MLQLKGNWIHAGILHAPACAFSGTHAYQSIPVTGIDMEFLSSSCRFVWLYICSC